MIDCGVLPVMMRCFLEKQVQQLLATEATEITENCKKKVTPDEFSL
jgi:hypothetical protein